jgi:hypothetical protein
MNQKFSEIDVKMGPVATGAESDGIGAVASSAESDRIGAVASSAESDRIGAVASSSSGDRQLGWELVCPVGSTAITKGPAMRPFVLATPHHSPVLPDLRQPAERVPEESGA